MFLGQYRHSFDDMSRLTIPSRFREPFSEGAYVTQGFDRNLLIMTAKTFQEIYQQVMALNMTDPLARLLLRLILGSASALEMDRSGSIQVPQNLRNFAGLDGEAVLVGQGDYFEVWAPALWQKQEIQIQDAEANTHRFTNLVLAPH